MNHNLDIQFVLSLFYTLLAGILSSTENVAVAVMAYPQIDEEGLNQLLKGGGLFIPGL